MDRHLTRNHFLTSKPLAILARKPIKQVATNLNKLNQNLISIHPARTWLVIMQVKPEHIPKQLEIDKIKHKKEGKERVWTVKKRIVAIK